MSALVDQAEAILASGVLLTTNADVGARYCERVRRICNDYRTHGRLVARDWDMLARLVDRTAAETDRALRTPRGVMERPPIIDIVMNVEGMSAGRSHDRR